MNHENDHSPASGGDRRSPDAELEARLVAWIAGEASAYEIAELERLVRENPELAAAKRRLEAVHGLLGDAARPDAAPLRLSEERRAKLLATLRATPAKPATDTPEKGRSSAQSATILPFAERARKQRRNRTWIVGLAACAAVGLFATITLHDFSLRKPARPDSQTTRLAFPTVADARETDKKRSEAELRNAETDQVAAGEDIAERRARNVQELIRRRAERERQKAAEVSASAETARQRPALMDTSAPAPGAPVISLRGLDAAVASDADGRGDSALSRPAERTEQDKRDAATNTLAYSRLNTQSRDFSPASSVITPNFLKDTGAAGSGGLLNFNAKPESSGMADFATFDRDSRGPQPSFSWSYYSAPANAPVGQVQPSAAPAPSIGTGDKAELAPIGAGNTDSNEKNSDDAVVLNGFVVASNRESAAVAVAADEVGAEKKLSGPPPPAVAAAPAKTAARVAAAPAKPAAQTASAKAKRAPVAPPATPILAERKADAPAADLPLVRPAQASLPATTELVASQEPFSTFSLHVGDVAFRLAQKALASGQLPDPASLRAEEFYNAFNYGEPSPAPADKIACRIEQAAHPSLQQRNLVRLAVKVPSTGRGTGTPLRLTVLLDTSGSMEREDRAATVRAALHSLASLLGPNDRLTLIGFARQPRLLAEAVAGDRADATLASLGAIPSDGGTNLEAALQLGRELALRHFLPAAQNRIVVLTDGAANLGNADPAQLAAAVEQLRAAHIAFDACGVGLDGLDDSLLEALTRRGDGRYTVLDSAAAADAGFARQLAGAFRPAAANVKLQVRFNPARVGRYRLVGFEKHRLRTEDFRNDAVDAAELAADEAAVAVYQVEALPQGTGELGDVFVRFRDTARGEMVERSWTMTYDAHAPAFDRATPTLQLAGTAALFAELLHDRPADLAERLDELAPTVNALRGRFAAERRVQEFAAMFEQARRLARR